MAIPVVLSLATIAALAQPAGVTLSPRPIGILNGELALTLPKGASVSRSPKFDMGSREVEEAKLTHGATQFTVVAYDLFVLPGKDFRAGIKKDVRLRDASLVKASIEDLQLSEGIAAYGLQPKVDTSRPGAALIYAVYVAKTGSTVKLLGFYVDPPSNASGEWLQLARQIARTLSVGEGKLTRPDLPDREIRIGVTYDAPQLTTPPKWESAGVAIQGDIRYRVYRSAELGATPSWCDIVLDPANTLPAPDEAKRTSGTILGKSVTWNTWSEGGSLHLSTGVVDATIEHLAIEVHCVAVDEAVRAEAKTMLESLHAP